MLATLVVISVNTSVADASSSALRNEMAGVAESVAQILDSRNQTTVALGPFTGPSDNETAGPGLQHLLREQLKRFDVSIDPAAEMAVRGTYRAEPSADGLTLRIRTTLVDANDRPLVEINSSGIADHPVRSGQLNSTVKNELAALSVMQPTANLPSDIPPKDRANLVMSALSGEENPPRIRGTVVFASASSPYGMEVIVDGKPRKPELRKGLVFIDIQRGEEYEVRLVNNSRHRAAARLMIDGLSSFSFSEVRIEEGPRAGEPAYDNWIIPPFGRGSIPGWHKRNRGEGNFQAFKVTQYADSAAAIFKQTSDLGTITAVFSAAWDADKDPPADLKEPPRSRSGSDATGFGRPKTGIVKPVRVQTGVVRSVVSIRYTRP